MPGRVGGAERTLAVGDSAAVPRRKLHVVRNAGDEAAMRGLFGVMRLLHHDVVTMCTWFARRGIRTDGEEVFASLLTEAF